MKRIEVMAKMQEENVAEEILNFLVEQEIIDDFYCDGEKLDAIYGLAQYLGEVAENESNIH